MELNDISPQQLRKAADLQERIQELQAELSRILGGLDRSSLLIAGGAPAQPKVGGEKRRTLSAAGIANIRAGVAKRTMRRAAKLAAGSEPRRKPKISAAGRKALSAKLKARWAERKAAGQTKL